MSTFSRPTRGRCTLFASFFFSVTYRGSCFFLFFFSFPVSYLCCCAERKKKKGRDASRSFAWKLDQRLGVVFHLPLFRVWSQSKLSFFREQNTLLNFKGEARIWANSASRDHLSVYNSNQKNLDFLAFSSCLPMWLLFHFSSCFFFFFLSSFFFPLFYAMYVWCLSLCCLILFSFFFFVAVAVA